MVALFIAAVALIVYSLKDDDETFLLLGLFLLLMSTLASYDDYGRDMYICEDQEGIVSAHMSGKRRWVVTNGEGEEIGYHSRDFYNDCERVQPPHIDGDPSQEGMALFEIEVTHD